MLPTHIDSIDNLLQGGFPAVGLSEIVGSESSGKSTLALHIIATAQQAKRTAILIDTDYSFDPIWARRHGVDTEKLIVVRPTSGMQMECILDEVMRTHSCDLVVLDTLDALPEANLWDLIPHLRYMFEAAEAACIILTRYRDMGDTFVSTANDLMRAHASLRTLLTIADISNNGISLDFAVKRIGGLPAPPLPAATFSINF